MHASIAALVVALSIALPTYAAPASAALTMISPTPGEVVAGQTVNVIVDTDIELAESPGANGYSLRIGLDTPEAQERAIATIERGHIFTNVAPGLHTVEAALYFREGAAVTRVNLVRTEFQTIPSGTAVAGIPSIRVSWWTLLRDALVFSLPFVGLGLILLWLHTIIRRGKRTKK